MGNGANALKVLSALLEEARINQWTHARKASMQIVPAGRMTADSFSRNETISQSSTARGMCKAIDASVFEKVLKARS